MQHYPKHYCGVFGVYGHPNAAELTYYGLYALQHRGQESAGIVTSDGHHFHAHKGMGLVSQVFTGEVLSELSGAIAVGHTRYSTSSSPLRTTATSRTPPGSAKNSRRAVQSFRPPLTAKSSCT